MDNITPNMAESKVLVSNSTGKAGSNVCKALKDAGFDVYGTTRGGKSIDKMRANGITSAVCNYTDKEQLTAAFHSTGAKLFFLITDFESAAKGKQKLEEQQGRDQIDAAKAAGIEFIVFCSVADCDRVNKKVKHFRSKLTIENYLKESGLHYAILRPVGFFENFNDAAHYNPLKKGHLKGIFMCSSKFVATYDIGRAAAVMFKDQVTWNGKILDCASWEGDLSEAAAAVAKVSGNKTTHGALLPYFVRYLFLPEIHRMCLYIENEKYSSSITAFKEVVPDAMSAEDWFRSVGQYGNGEKFKE